MLQIIRPGRGDGVPCRPVCIAHYFFRIFLAVQDVKCHLAQVVTVFFLCLRNGFFAALKIQTDNFGIFHCDTSFCFIRPYTYIVGDSREKDKLL